MQLRGGAKQDGVLAHELAHGIDCACYFTDNSSCPIVATTSSTARIESNWRSNL